METILEPGRIEKNYWRDLWRYRELFQVLAWRDVSVRYKQTVIGILWALIRPFLTMVVFTLIFQRIAGLPSEGSAPYPLMVFAGFLVSFAILLGMMVWYRFAPGWRLLLLPGFMGLAILASLGPGLWITSLNVRYRDFRYVVPFLVQFGLYLSPVGFSSSVVPEKWRLLYSLNPMVGVIDGFRWCILGGESRIYWPGFGFSLAAVAFLLWLGIRQFRKQEKTFADSI